MIRSITLDEVKKAQEETVWHYGNGLLYQMCHEHFEHKEDQYILAKVLFIGRIYAAAIERRKTENNDINDHFYTDAVAPTFKNSNTDKHLAALRAIGKVDNNQDVIAALRAHYDLTNAISKITGIKKRSFSSKYLHFHLPEMFFIYDTRAVAAIRNFVTKVPRDLNTCLEGDNADLEYAKFYCKCLELKRIINRDYNITLDNRQLDNLLINTANETNSALKKAQ